MVTPVTMKQLLEAGVHFGHQTRRWNPKMRQFIFTERNGIHIIDLQQTVTRLDEAINFVREVVAGGNDVLIIGTKKQAAKRSIWRRSAPGSRTSTTAGSAARSPTSHDSVGASAICAT